MSSIKTILYADDDPDDIDFVKRAFEKRVRDVHLLTCKDGWEALQVLTSCQERKEMPCLVILDMNMPKLNGRQTLQRIRQDRRFDDIPIVFFTTSNFQDDVTFASRFKAGYVVKPIDSRQMSLIVDTFLAYCSSGLEFDRII